MLKKGARSDKKQRTSVTVGSSGASSSAATFDQQVKAWFKQYADPDDETQMGGEGIEKLFSEMELSMESVRCLSSADSRDLHLTPPNHRCTPSCSPGRSTRSDLAPSGSRTSCRDSVRMRGFSCQTAPLPCPADRERNSITDTMSLKSFLVANEMTIYPDDPAPMANSQFKQFYTFLFPYLREEGQKSLRGEIAQAVWSIVLVPKFPLANSFIEFTQVRLS